MIRTRILGTGEAVLGTAKSPEELAHAILPAAHASATVRAIGIDTRYWVDPDTSVADMATAALRDALSDAGLPAQALRRIILSTSTGGDHIIPATANAIADAFDLDDTCDCFDVNNSCVGVLTAFDLAARSTATGLGPVAVIAAERFSRYLSPAARRSWLVLGDAASAVILGQTDEDEGVLSSWLRNRAELRGRMSTERADSPELASAIAFGATADELMQCAIRAIRDSSAAVLAEAGVAMSDVNWVLPHQPNGTMLRAIAEALEVGPERMVPVVHEIGSVGSAAIAMSLHRLWRSRRPRPGDTILMTGVGSGTAVGAILLQVAS